jgi:hypothetical protein
MTSALALPIITGLFSLGGALGGIFLANHFARRADERRIATEDKRRWITDRRHIYAAYLTVVSESFQEISSFISLLSYDGSEPIPDEDEEILKQAVFDSYRRWDEKLQPVLGELQLLADPTVAELADRTSWAIMELTGFADARKPFNFFTPYLNGTFELIDATRNAMRRELGLSDPISTFPMPEDWPWLPDSRWEEVEEVEETEMAKSIAPEATGNGGTEGKRSSPVAPDTENNDSP